MNKTLRTTLAVLGIIALAAVIFLAGAQIGLAARGGWMERVMSDAGGRTGECAGYPGHGPGMMYGRPMMHDGSMMQGGPMMGGGMMGGGMMGGGMMGDGMMGSGMMGSGMMGSGMMGAGFTCPYLENSGYDSTDDPTQDPRRR